MGAARRSTLWAASRARSRTRASSTSVSMSSTSHSSSIQSWRFTRPTFIRVGRSGKSSRRGSALPRRSGPVRWCAGPADPPSRPRREPRRPGGYLDQVQRRRAAGAGAARTPRRTAVVRPQPGRVDAPTPAAGDRRRRRASPRRGPPPRRRSRPTVSIETRGMSTASTTSQTGGREKASSPASRPAAGSTLCRVLAGEGHRTFGADPVAEHDDLARRR